MGQRHSDAVSMQEGGASNPPGIARSLVKACDECLAEGVQPSRDAAVRLIVHQLAFVCDTWSIDQPSDFNIYATLMDECREKTNA